MCEDKRKTNGVKRRLAQNTWGENIEAGDVLTVWHAKCVCLTLYVASRSGQHEQT